jgi:hypothetical protein
MKNKEEFYVHDWQDQLTLAAGTPPMEQKHEYWPHWKFKTKREWKRDVRKRWVAYRKALRALRDGCAYLPIELDLVKFEERDAKMKEWFKKA